MKAPKLGVRSDPECCSFVIGCRFVHIWVHGAPWPTKSRFLSPRRHQELAGPRARAPKSRVRVQGTRAAPRAAPPHGRCHGPGRVLETEPFRVEGLPTPAGAGSLDRENRDEKERRLEALVKEVDETRRVPYGAALRAALSWVSRGRGRSSCSEIGPWLAGELRGSWPAAGSGSGSPRLRGSPAGHLVEHPGLSTGAGETPKGEIFACQRLTSCRECLEAPHSAAAGGLERQPGPRAGLRRARSRAPRFPSRRRRGRRSSGPRSRPSTWPGGATARSGARPPGPRGSGRWSASERPSGSASGCCAPRT